MIIQTWPSLIGLIKSNAGEIVKSIADNNYHRNLNGPLPITIITEFLSIEILAFFHVTFATSITTKAFSFVLNKSFTVYSSEVIASISSK